MVAQSGVLPENRCAKLRPPLEFELVAAPECLKCQDASTCFQPGEGPRRGLLCDCENRLCKLMDCFLQH